MEFSNDTNEINAIDYIKLNEEFIKKEKMLEDKIKEDIKNNSKIYPSNAEELFCFDYANDLTEEQEERLVLFESLITERFKEEYAELDIIRDNIVKYAGHVTMNENNEVKSGEN